MAWPDMTAIVGTGMSRTTSGSSAAYRGTSRPASGRRSESRLAPAQKYRDPPSSRTTRAEASSFSAATAAARRSMKSASM